MRRRELIAMLGAIAACPLAAHAQQPAKMPVVGFIVPGTQQSHGKWVAAFTARLAEFGWIDGRIVVLAYRWAAGHPERYPQTAAELATLKVDVVATSVNGGVVAMKQVAPATPIVMAALSSGSPFIESLSHPGGMVTGMSPLGEELGRKRLELLTQVARQLRHLAVVGVAGDLKRVPETALVTSAAQQHGIQVTPLMVKQAEEIAPTIASIEGRAEALYVIIDPLISLNQAQFNMLALKAGLPTCTACLSM